MIHIDTIYESEAFRLLAQGMKDKHAVAICYTLKAVDENIFRLLNDWCAQELVEQDAEIAEGTKQYAIGDLTTQLVFKANDIHNISNLQLVFDEMEKALVQSSLRLANSEHAHKVTRERADFAAKNDSAAIAKLTHERGEAYREYLDIERQLKSVCAERDVAYEKLKAPQSSAVYNKRVAALHHVLFDDDPTDIRERFARLQEEVYELGQAIGISKLEYPKLLDRVYSRAVGSVPQELGGVAMTFASLCHELDFTLLGVAFKGLVELESPEVIAKVRAKRKTRHGRGLLPGFDARESTIGDVMQSRDYSTGAPNVFTCSEEEWNKHNAKHVENVVQHKLYRTGDADAPDVIKDRNGEVVLGLCKDCNQGEAELAQPCIPVVLKRPENYRWDINQWVAKKSGSQWRGRVVGFYATKLTPEGYAVESVNEPGSVQLYPVAALIEYDHGR